MRKIYFMLLSCIVAFAFSGIALADYNESISEEQLSLLTDIIAYENTAYEIENTLLSNEYEYHAFYPIGILSGNIGRDTAFASYQATNQDDSIMYISDTFSVDDRSVTKLDIQIKYSDANWMKTKQLLDNMFGDCLVKEMTDEKSEKYTVFVWKKNNTTVSIKNNDDLPVSKTSLLPKTEDSVFEVAVENPTNIAGDKIPSSQRSFSIKGGIQFGMSKEDVSKILGTPDDSQEDILFYITQVSNIDASMILFFDNNSLFRLGYVFTKEHSSDNLYLNDFNQVDEMLQNKYGIQQPKEKWENGLLKSVEDYRGLAVAQGDLSITNNWYTLDASIKHDIRGDNYKIQHTLIYSDPWYKTSASTNDDI